MKALGLVCVTYLLDYHALTLDALASEMLLYALMLGILTSKIYTCVILRKA